MGGEMSYRYLDANGPAAAPFRYELTTTTYIIYAPPGSLAVTIYSRTTGAPLSTVIMRNPTSSPATTHSGPAGCAVIGPSQRFVINKFVGVVELPMSSDGYYAVTSQAARNATTNLFRSDSESLILYVSMTPPLIPNHSPVFSDTAVAIVCQNDTTITLNNAFDADGDRLTYAFGSPYGRLANSGTTFPPLPNSMAYNAGYSTAAPFGTGAGNFAIL